MIIINPKFHRYIWLNFSPFRVVAMPLLLALIIYAFSNSEEYIWQAAIFFPALYIYFVVVFLWGNYEAASGAVKDVGGNTWDFQKMSALSPWQLVIGKLFGTTSYVWYAATFLIFIMVFSYGFLERFEPLEGLYKVYPSPIKPVLYLIFSGVIGHATALLLSVGSLRTRGKASFALAFIIGLIVSCNIFSITIGFDFKTNSFEKISEMNWHGYQVEMHSFVLLSLGYFFFWIVVEIQRNFRSELQYKNSPIIFMIFLVTLCVYITGLVNNAPSRYSSEIDNVLIVKCYISFTILAIFTYIAVFLESGSIAKYKRWLYAFKNREVKRFFEDTPAWVGCLVLLLPVYLLLNLEASDLPAKQHGFSEMFSVFSLTSAVMLFMLRDGLVLHVILGGGIDRHKAFVLLLFYGLLYGLIPYIVISVIEDKVYLRQALMIFYPFGGSSFYEGCLPVIVQIIIALSLFWNCFIRYSKS